MRTRTFLIAAAGFSAALLAGIAAGDAVRDDTRPTLAPVVGEAIPLVPNSAPGVSATTAEGFVFPETHTPVVVAGEYSSTPSGEGAGFDGTPPDPGFAFATESVIVEGGLAVELGAMGATGPSGTSALRFLDFCADHGGDECPTGIGATVLGAFDGGGDPGPFDLLDLLYPHRDELWRCDPPEEGPPTVYQLLMLTTHPARLEVTYYPEDEPGAARGAVIDSTDPAHPEFAHFVATLAETGGPAAGSGLVQSCLQLEGDATPRRRYVIEVTATSYTGEIDSEVLTFRSPDLRERPPVEIVPLNDYAVDVYVPVEGDGRNTSVVRVIDVAVEGVTCDQIEADSVPGEDGVTPRRHVVMPPESGYVVWSGYRGTYPIASESSFSDPSWPYDPAYTFRHVWNLNLREGRDYVVCIWWVRSPARSFDSASVVEREAYPLSTPDRTSARISLLGVRATESGLPPEALELNAACGTVRVPAVALGGDGSVTWDYGAGPVLCDYGGYEQPAVTLVGVSYLGLGYEFLIDTPTGTATAIASTEATLDLSTRRGSGLCGSSFGACEPPTTDYPGPQVALLVEHLAGSTGRRTDWAIGGPFVPATPPSTPTELPETPRIDYRASGVAADGRNAVVAEAAFDRPVTLTARLYGSPDDECLGGVTREVTVAEFSEVHSVRFEGLCLLSPYWVDLTVTDMAGTTVEFRNSPVPPALHWPGEAQTEGWQVEYVVRLISHLPTHYYLGEAAVTTPGRLVSLITESRCLVNSSSDGLEAQWGDQVRVTVAIRFTEGIRSDGDCARDPRGDYWEGGAVATFTIDEFRSGPVIIPIEVTEGHSGAASSGLEIVIVGTVVGD